MPAVYSPQDILSRIDNPLIAEYTKKNNILNDIDILKLKQKDGEVIYKAIIKLPDDIRERVEQDLRHINELADSNRSKELFNELKKAAPNDLPEFRQRNGGADRAIWTLMHHPDIFEKALHLTQFHNASGHFTRFSFKSNSKPDLSKKATDLLGKGIREYFQNYDGRGKYCAIEQHEFNGNHYLIAYPSEHTDVKREFKSGGKLEPVLRQDAFTVVFIFSNTDTFVEVYVDAVKDVKRELFIIWAKEIMGLQKVDSEQKQSFDLEAFKSAEHDFQLSEHTLVHSVAVCGLYFVPKHDLSKSYHITADVSVNKNALYDELKAKGLEPFQIKKVKLAVTLIDGDKLKTRRFEVGTTGCSLKHDGVASELRQFLKDVGIDIS